MCGLKEKNTRFCLEIYNWNSAASFLSTGYPDSCYWKTFQTEKIFIDFHFRSNVAASSSSSAAMYHHLFCVKDNVIMLLAIYYIFEKKSCVCNLAFYFSCITFQWIHLGNCWACKVEDSVKGNVIGVHFFLLAWLGGGV